MPQFPFLRSNHDKDPSPPNTSNHLISSPSIPPSSSERPQFTHPFTSSSTNASSSTVNANNTSSTSTSSPAFLPTESPTSKYHPSRLLRRKASLSNRSTETPTFQDSDPLPANANISSNVSEPPTSPRRLPSSPRGFPSSPRGFFFDKDPSDKDKFATYPTARRGSDTSRYITSNYGLPSPTSAKRSAFVYNGRLTSEGERDQDVVIIPSSSREEDPLSANLAALGMKNDSQTQALSSSLPKVLDGGLGSTSGIGIFGKIMNPQNQNDSQYHYEDRTRPPTPPDSAKTPFYPTALSPPRRPMPKSPRAMHNQHHQQRSSTPTQTQQRPETPPSVGMMQALSAVGGPSNSNPRNASPTPLSGSDRPRPRRGSEKPRITAEWLARKPSLSNIPSDKGNEPTRRKHRPSLSVDQGQPHTLSFDPPRPTRQGSGSLDDSPRITAPEPGSGTVRRPSFSSDTEGLSSDGEIGLNPRRRSLLTGSSTPSRSNGNGRRKSSVVAGSSSGYEVIVSCVDNRQEGLDADEDGGEIKWEVTIKKQSILKSEGVVGSSPVQLSTSGVVAPAPLSASSINLSLSLDQPTGKLVFISFPMDIHATPTRKRRPSTATGTSSISRINHLVSSPRPSTPPNQLANKISSDLDGTPGTPNHNLTPTRTPSSRRKPPPPWPSPRENLPPPSPPTSPRDVFTPKKTTPTRMGVNGDLLNKVTRGEGLE